MSVGFFVEAIAGTATQMGLESLIDFVMRHYPAQEWRELSDDDRKILEHFQALVPNTYRRSGILFEVFAYQKDSGEMGQIIIPRSFGGSPTDALINDKIFNDADIPELPPEVRARWVEQRVKMTELALRGEGKVERSAFWWEHDRTSREWSVEHVDIVAVERQADRVIKNTKSLADLSRALPSIMSLRANAAQWLDLRDLMEARIRDEQVRARIQNLAEANQQMALQIDAALADMKRAQEYLGYLETLKLIGLIGNAAEFLSSDGFEGSKQRMMVLENYSMTVIERAGNEMKRLDVELKNVFGGYVDDASVMPSFDIITIHRITNPHP